MLSGCNVEWTRKHELYCRMDEQLELRDTLYFGLSIPGGGRVADAAFKQFADDAIGTAFPNGFTIVEAEGTWRGADGASVSEPSRVVTIVHPDDGASEAAIRAIVQRYRTTFRQEAVLRERTSVCVSL
ncbi:MAG TPA: DUF3574 domain-containing protein [Rhodanobacteraceae bacterium]